MFNDIYEKLGVTTDLQRLCVNELIYCILREPSNKCGADGKEEELRKKIFGDSFSSLQDNILSIAGYWFNDLELALKKDLGFDGDIPDLLFKMLEGVEIIEGVGYKI